MRRYDRVMTSLAVAIGTARKLPVIRLDQLYHLPQTNWVPRPRDEFGQLRDTANAGDN